MSFITRVGGVPYKFEEDTFTDQAVFAIEEVNLVMVAIGPLLIACPVTELLVHQVAEMDADGNSNQTHCSMFNYN